MSANIIESFFVSLGFEVNTEKIDEFKKKANELRESAVTLGSIFTGAAAGIALLVEGVASSMGDLASFAELNDVSAKSVAALGKIATENDGSLEGMKSTIQSLNKTIGEASIGIGRGAMTFEKLGLKAKDANGKVKTVDDLLSEVADKMQGLSRQEQIGMAEKLGIDPQFVKVLEKGSENLAKLREEAELLNPFTEADYQLADQVDKLFLKAKATLGTFTKMLGVSLLPTVKEVLQNYLEWFKASRKATSDVFVRALKLMAGAVGTVWDWVVRLVSGLKNAYDWLTQFKTITYLAAGALAAFVSVKTYDLVLQIGAAIRMLTLRMATFNATAMILPAIIGAVILALGLLIDDYVNWKEGNDSVIGGLVEQFPALLGIIKTIEDGVGSFIDFWLQQWDSLKGPLSSLAGAIWNLVTTVVGALWPVVKMVFTGWAYILAAVIPIVATLIEWIAGFLVGAIRFVVDALTWIVQAATAVFQGVVAVVQFAIDAIVAYFTWWWQTTVQIFQFIVGIIGQVVDAVMGGVKGAVDWVMGILDSAQQKVMGFIDSVVGAISKVGELLGLTSSSKPVKVDVLKDPESSGDPMLAGSGQIETDSFEGQQSKPAAQAVAQAPEPGSQQQSDPTRPRQMTPIAQAVAQAPSMQSAPADAAKPQPAMPVVQQPGGVIGRAGNTTNTNSTVTQTTTIQAPITVNSSDPAKAGEAVRQELDKMNKQTTRNGQSAVAL